MSWRDLKLHDSNWMVYKVLREDVVHTDAEPALPPQMRNVVARTGTNLLKALLLGHRASFRVRPDTADGEPRFGRVTR